jgi:hypothetical protein
MTPRNVFGAIGIFGWIAMLSARDRHAFHSGERVVRCRNRLQGIERNGNGQLQPTLQGAQFPFIGARAGAVSHWAKSRFDNLSLVRRSDTACAVRCEQGVCHVALCGPR